MLGRGTRLEVAIEGFAHAVAREVEAVLRVRPVENGPLTEREIEEIVESIWRSRPLEGALLSVDALTQHAASYRWPVIRSRGRIGWGGY